jgi:C-terminal processing protease CtpA/Prc
MRKAARALVVAVAVAAASAASAKEGASAEKYAKDVEFLLSECGKKAASLLQRKGVDWDAVEKEFRAAVKAVKSDPEHLKLCSRLLARLRDGHAGVVDTKVKWPDESKGRRWGGPGAFLACEGDVVLVKNVWGPAKDAGLEAGMRLDQIDGKPARAWLDAKVAELRDTTGYSTDQQALYAACHWGLGGWDETKIVFTPQGGKAVTVPRDATMSTVPSGPAFPPAKLKSVGRQSYGKTASGFAYVHLRDVPDDLAGQLDTALADVGDAPGLILDCRANGGGGTDHDAVFSRFVAAGQTWRGAKSAGKSPYSGPMVVILDAGVRSAGETVAGMFISTGRAYVIGESATAGMSSRKETLAVPSGLFTVRIAVQSQGRNLNGGRGIEGIGVAPQELVPYAREDLAKGVDTLIRRAEELLKGGFPEGKVAYQPPKK